MAKYSKGDIVILDFPFTDQSGSKRRPSLVVIAPQGNNYVIAQITKQNRGPYPISLTQSDLSSGTLGIDSFVMPDVIVTVKESKIYAKIGSITTEKLTEVIDKIIDLLNS